MDLAPLGELHPATTKPDVAPLSQAALEAAFTLHPGPYSLPESCKGTPLDVSALAGTAPGTGGGGAAPSTGTAAAPPKPIIKLKLKTGPS